MHVAGFTRSRSSGPDQGAVKYRYFTAPWIRPIERTDPDPDHAFYQYCTTPWCGSSHTVRHCGRILLSSIYIVVSSSSYCIYNDNVTCLVITVAISNESVIRCLDRTQHNKKNEKTKKLIVSACSSDGVRAASLIIREVDSLLTINIISLYCRVNSVTTFFPIIGKWHTLCHVDVYRRASLKWLIPLNDFWMTSEWLLNDFWKMSERWAIIESYSENRQQPFRGLYYMFVFVARKGFKSGLSYISCVSWPLTMNTCLVERRGVKFIDSFPFELISFLNIV